MYINFPLDEKKRLISVNFTLCIYLKLLGNGSITGRGWKLTRKIEGEGGDDDDEEEVSFPSLAREGDKNVRRLFGKTVGEGWFLGA